MKLLAVQLGARIVGDLRYAVAQAFALMVAATNQVFRSGINEVLLKTLQDVVAGLREELFDSEAKR